MLASRNGATYLKHGKDSQPLSPSTCSRTGFTHHFPGVGELEVYPNRDSVSYVDIYGLKGISTMYRGTYRFKGWCETLDLIKAIGLIDDGDKDYTGMTYRQFVAEKAGLPGKDLRKELKDKPGLNPTDRALDSLEWLGLFSDKVMGYGVTSPYEITSDLMIRRCGWRIMSVIWLSCSTSSWPPIHDGKREVISFKDARFRHSGNEYLNCHGLLPCRQPWLLR